MSTMDPTAPDADPMMRMAIPVEHDEVVVPDTPESVAGVPEDPDQDPWLKRNWKKAAGAVTGLVAGVALIATLGGGPSEPEVSDLPSGGGGIDFTDEFGNGFRLEPEQIDYIDNETGYIHLNDGSVYDLEGNLISSDAEESESISSPEPEDSGETIDTPSTEVRYSDEQLLEYSLAEGEQSLNFVERLRAAQLLGGGRPATRV